MVGCPVSGNVVLLVNECNWHPFSVVPFWVVLYFAGLVNLLANSKHLSLLVLLPSEINAKFYL